jgi:hypothetical protein
MVLGKLPYRPSFLTKGSNMFRPTNLPVKRGKHHYTPKGVVEFEVGATRRRYFIFLPPLGRPLHIFLFHKANFLDPS